MKRIYTLSGESMFPFLRDGDKVVISLLPINTCLRIRDILVCRVGQKCICHRVIGIEKEGQREVYYVKGDFSNGINKIQSKDIEGKVIAFIRDGKVVDVRFYTSWLYFAFARAFFALKTATIVILSVLYKCRIYREICRFTFNKRKLKIIFLPDVKNNEEVSSFANFCEDSLLDKKIKAYLAIYGKKIVGKILWYEEEKNIFIVGPYVRNLYRGRGIGRELVEYIRSRCKNCTILYCQKDNFSKGKETLECFYRNFPSIRKANCT